MRRSNAPQSVQVGNGVVEYLSTDSGNDVVRFAGSHESPLVVPITNNVELVEVDRLIVEDVLKPALE